MKQTDWMSVVKRVGCSAVMLCVLELIVAAVCGWLVERELLPLQLACVIAEILMVSALMAVCYWNAGRAVKSKLPIALSVTVLVMIVNVLGKSLIAPTEKLVADWRMMVFLLITICAGVAASRRKKTYTKHCAR